MSERARLARGLLNREDTGILSTLSADVEGYPFGSVAPYALNYDGEPMMLISDIAQHTRNIKRDHRVSLTVFERMSGDPQAGGRVTWIGNARPVDAADGGLQHRYLRYFPWSESYFATHDFSLYRIELVRARFIGGFGQIFWLSPNELLAENPFRDAELEIVEHMNRDHGSSLVHYCALLGETETDGVTMTGIDAEGFDLRVGRRKLRMDFDAPIAIVDEARAAMVKLARRSAV